MSILDGNVISLHLLWVMLAMVDVGYATCGAEKLTHTSGSPSSRVRPNNDLAEKKMQVKIGGKTFKVTLEDNPTVTELKELLPLSVKMTELNGNEKYYHFFTSLPTNANRPGTIQTGDLMLYGDKSLVLFYKTFKTSYEYTRLGRIDDPSGLAAAVGAGDISVTFEAD
jgi:hypothetical protein